LLLVVLKIGNNYTLNKINRLESHYGYCEEGTELFIRVAEPEASYVQGVFQYDLSPILST